MHIQFSAGASSLAPDATSSIARSRSPAKRDARDAFLGSGSDEGYVNERDKGKSRDVLEISSSSEDEQDRDILEAVANKKRGLYLRLFNSFFWLTHSLRTLLCSQEAS